MNILNWFALSPINPEIFLGVVGLLLLLYGSFRGAASASFITSAVLGALVVAMGIVCKTQFVVSDTIGGMVVADNFSAFIKILILGGMFAALAISVSWLKENQILKFEYPILVLFSGIGSMLMVSSVNLLSLYVSLELSALSLYVLAAIRRDNLLSTEAGLKYFILGAISSGLLLFGISIIYGYTGSIGYAGIASALTEHNIGVIIGATFVMAGLCFKISAVPFHMWTPDVYEGAPTPVTALFAIVPKVAAIALIMRILFDPLMAINNEMMQIILFISIASMTIGAIAGILQNNIKRLLAYSSIANIGYALLGLISGDVNGVSAVLIYLTIYMVTLAGFFAVLMGLRREGQEIEKISDLAGLSKKSPFAAYIMAILLISMAGIPPFAGFFAKLFIFQSIIAAGYTFVAIFGVLASVIGAYYYLRIIKIMFFDSAIDTNSQPTAAFCYARGIVTVLSVAFIVLLTIWPNALMAQANVAAMSLFN